jgi:dynein heavy chain
MVIDGPIEPNWVENLNSVLDDNRKLCFGAGESIGLTDKMKIVLETYDLKFCSPATISRCSIVFMEDADEMIPLKAHINKWIRTLPGILISEIDRLDMVINYFLIHIRDNFMDPEMLVHKVSKK